MTAWDRRRIGNLATTKRPYPTTTLFPDCRVDSDREKEQDKQVAELRQRLETLEERFSKFFFLRATFVLWLQRLPSNREVVGIMLDGFWAFILLYFQSFVLKQVP